MTIDEALKELQRADDIAGNYTPSAIYSITKVLRELVLANTPLHLRPDTPDTATPPSRPLGGEGESR